MILKLLTISKTIIHWFKINVAQQFYTISLKFMLALKYVSFSSKENMLLLSILYLNLKITLATCCKWFPLKQFYTVSSIFSFLLQYFCFNSKKLVADFKISLDT